MIFEDIVTQHAEQATLLWLLRDRAVSRPDYDLKDLAKLDSRLDVHLEGLRAAGDKGWKICRDALGMGESGEVFAAAVISFESGDDTRIKVVLGVCRT